MIICERLVGIYRGLRMMVHIV